MSEPAAWTAVDALLAPKFAPHDDALERALARSREAGLPDIAVSPMQGKLLHVLVKAVSATRVLEVGTLGGYSTIWMARALPVGGSLVSLEREPKHAAVARENLAGAGVGERVEVLGGPAIETLPRLADEGAGPFDLVFIDANKDQIPDYFGWALKLTRPGSLIVVDNVVRRGKVVDADTDDPAVNGCRTLFDRLEAEPRVVATVVQTVGAKGHDGLAIATVL